MRAILIILLCYIYCVLGKNNLKPLTESMGQEVIEIAAPIKDLPQDVDEEPSAEVEEDKTTTTTIKAATKKDFPKLTTNDPSKKVKDVDKIDGRRLEDDEARIEKELSDVYKDSLDYKADSAEVIKDLNTTVKAETSSDKPIERARQEFRFQPESNDPKAIARFRTSIDEITCDRKLSGQTEIPISTDGVCKSYAANILIWTAVLYNVNFI